MMESIITATKSFVSSDSRSPKGRAVSQSVSQSIRFTHARASADAYLPDDHVTKDQKKRKKGRKRLRLTSVSSYFADTPSGVCDIRHERRDNPIGRRAAGSTGGGKCRRTHVPVPSGYRRERERESVFISPSARVLPNRH
ncbi:hypothetical protein ALC57_17213 [Trachymyrmex cornetzi]|uniref:Uncharacterized protein n=1 Tax=Trachymyrmex cornetzi TaxID=471704 RepID=A0A195DCJ6_9HYME|nr:hypothetical protein ALC57_17213 [Trachymyrmex cornetzi]